MDFGNESSPVFNIARMMIQKSEVQRPVPISSPRKVKEGGARNVDPLDPHALYVIQAGHGTT